MNDKTAYIIDQLSQGNVVFFATETVFAMAADIFNQNAIDKIYNMKGRDKEKPLAVMVANANNIEKIAITNPQADKLFAKFCPGPLTIILPKCKNSIVPDYFNNGFDNIAIRIPQNQLAQDILKNYDGIIAATSVNPSGEDAATTKKQVEDYFGNNLTIADDESVTSTIASTIVDLSGSEMKILRTGAISKQQILDAIN